LGNRTNNFLLSAVRARDLRRGYSFEDRASHHGTLTCPIV